MTKLTMPGRDTVHHLTTWPRTAVRYIRSAVPFGGGADEQPPPYKSCAGCRKGGRDDQKVPDPDQFTTKKGVTPAGDVVGNAAVAPARDAEIKLIDAAPVWCDTCRAWYHAIGCYSTHRAHD